ncbi:MAG: outer membrane beta-barrel family protein, partial [Rufibacter sp.]
TNAGLSMNYRTGKVNFFGNYSYSFNQRFFILDLQRKVEHEGQKTFFDQYNYRRSLAHNHTVRLGVDYFLGKNDVVGLLVDGIDNASTVAITNETHIREVLEGPVASSLGLTNDLESQGRNQMINVNYKHTFESSKTELSVNADYSLSSARQQDNILIQYQSTGGGERQPAQQVRSNSPSRITIRSVKADLSHPFSQGTKMEAGLKASQVFSDNNLFFEEYAQDHWQADAGRTNHFQYTELIGAAYANLNASFSQYKVQAGVRVEYTDADGHSLTLGQRTRQEYWKVFPSVLVSRKVTQANTLTFSYNRRIDRPAYRDLYPFIFFLDPFTYFHGDPYLRPQYTNNFQVSYAFLKELVVSAAYSQTADPITDVIKQDNASKIGYATRENLNQFRYANVSLVAPVNVTSWWRANTTFTVFYNHYQSSFLKSNLDAAQATAQFSTQQVVTLPNKLTAELAASYQSASVVGVIQRKPLYSMSLGIQKQVLAGKGTVRLSVQDLFNTNKVRTMVAYQNMDMQLLQHWESRVVRVGFTYNFGKGDQKPAATRKTGAEEENRRAVIQNQ